MQELIVKLRTDPEFRAKGAQVRDQILASPEVAAYLQGIWRQLTEWLRSDLAAADSSVKTQLAAAVTDIGARLGNDAAMRQWIDETIERMATVLVERNRDKVGRFIADQVGAWDDRHMVEQVELNIGKDLQFIRINGTLVGGMVGLLLFVLNRLLTL